MYENVTYESILGRMLARVPDKFDKREGSVIWDTHSPTAIELQILYIELDAILREAYGDTASREFLILLCKDRGITPSPATNAVLKGEFTPANIDVSGRRFNIGAINYAVTEKISDGKYKVECETQGIEGNQYLGEMIPVDYINGLKTATLTEILIPGEDEEDTEALRQRYFDSLSAQAFGGNRADYIAKVMGISGVGAVKVTSVWNGDIPPAELIPCEKVSEWYGSVVASLDTEVAAWLSAVYTAAREKKLTVGGTILITIVDSDDYGEASAALIDNVQTVLDPTQNSGEGIGVAPIGHVVNVKSASATKVYVEADVTFEEEFGWENLSEALTEAVAEYLLELRKGWADSDSIIVRVSRVEAKMLAVKGVVDITNTRLNGVPSNLVLGGYEIPIVGGVSG